MNAATAREPVTVLGAAAQLMGIDRILPGMRIWVGSPGQWFYVTGILNPVPATYAPEINPAVLVGFPAAEKYLHFDGHPSQIYVRTTPDNQAVTTAVAGQPGNLQPGHHLPALGMGSPPRPTPRARSTPCSSAWARSRCWSARSGWPASWSSRCRNAAPRSGCAGARRHPRPDPRPVPVRGHLPSLAGGAAGVIIGAAATAAYARGYGETVVIPPRAWAGGAAVIIGALAGLLPAIRAARLSPTQALWTV